MDDITNVTESLVLPSTTHLHLMIDRKQMYVVPQDKWAALKLQVHFVQWCQNSFLQLNIRTCWSISNANVVKGQAVERPDKYKYLVMFTDDTFDHKVEDL